MCAPVLQVAGGVLGAVGSIMGGQQSDQAAQIQAQAAQTNAQMALDEAAGRMGQISTKVGMAIGAQRAGYAAANLDVNQGSPLLMQAFSAAQGNIDQQLTLAGGLNRSAGQRFVASEAYQRGADARQAGFLGAGVSLLQGLSAWKGLGGFGVAGSDPGVPTFGGNGFGAAPYVPPPPAAYGYGY